MGDLLHTWGLEDTASAPAAPAAPVAVLPLPVALAPMALAPMAVLPAVDLTAMAVVGDVWRPNRPVATLAVGSGPVVSDVEAASLRVEQHFPLDIGSRKGRPMPSRLVEDYVDLPTAELSNGMVVLVLGEARSDMAKYLGMGVVFPGALRLDRLGGMKREVLLLSDGNVLVQEPGWPLMLCRSVNKVVEFFTYEIQGRPQTSCRNAWQNLFQGDKCLGSLRLKRARSE